MTVMPRDHEWTVADVANTPDDGLRYELVDGVRLVSSAPRNLHQIVLGELNDVLRAACPAGVRVMFAPTDYQPTLRRSLQPDLLVARRASTRWSRRSRHGRWPTGTGSTPAAPSVTRP